MEEQIWKTTDLHLTAYILSTNEARLVVVERAGNKQATFVFENPEVCSELQEKYFSHQGITDPFQMSICLRELKSRLYSANKNQL